MLVVVASALLAFGGCLDAGDEGKSDSSLAGSEIARDSVTERSLGATPVATASPDMLDEPSSPKTLPPERHPALGHKLGPLDISISWRTRAEGWNWFEG